MDNDLFEKGVEPETDESEESVWIADYGLSIAPNDFNVSTLYNLIKKGKIVIPHFQRNFVWKKRQASRLIESLILGLPVPQIYLYQNIDDKFLIIDGQQRLISIFLYMEGRFPKDAFRAKIGEAFRDINNYKKIIDDENEFLNFILDLQKTNGSDEPLNPLNGKKFSQLNFDNNCFGDKFELATIRTIVIKQLKPEEESPSSMYEIFNRLNTGGTKLNAQEIRSSLYYNTFFDMISNLNDNISWRNNLFGIQQKDARLRDIEIIFRGFALSHAVAYPTESGDIDYKPSMTSFVNNFCKKSKQMSPDAIELHKNIFVKFTEVFSDLNKPFHNKSQKFTAAIYDAIFAVLTAEALKNNNIDLIKPVQNDKLNILKNDDGFKDAILESTASLMNVKKRIERTQTILLG